MTLARLSSSAGRTATNIKVRTQSPLNLGSEAQNGNVLAFRLRHVMLCDLCLVALSYVVSCCVVLCYSFL